MLWPCFALVYAAAVGGADNDDDYDADDDADDADDNDKAQKYITDNNNEPKYLGSKVIITLTVTIGHDGDDYGDDYGDDDEDDDDGDYDDDVDDADTVAEAARLLDLCLLV